MHASDRLQAVLERLDLIKYADVFYADVFRKEEIDDGNLHLLTEACLREIGPLGPSESGLLPDWIAQAIIRSLWNPTE